MKSNYRVLSALGACSLLSGVLLTGCFSSDSDNSDTTSSLDTPTQPDSGIYFDITAVNYSAISVDESTLALGARQLASQCAQCHGTYGVAVRDWPNLYDASGISNAMQIYQDVDLYGGSSMHLHALAYTADEVDLLKTYYSKVNYAQGE